MSKTEVRNPRYSETFRGPLSINPFGFRVCSVGCMNPWGSVRAHVNKGWRCNRTEWTHTAHDANIDISPLLWGHCLLSLALPRFLCSLLSYLFLAPLGPH